MVEFTDLARELMGKFGFNQNRIAAIAKVSASMVSQILNGERSPGEPALELLRREHRALTVPEPGPTRTQPDEMHDQLEYLKRNYPPGFEAAKATVGALHKQAVQEVILHKKGKAPDPSSALSATAKTTLGAYVEGARAGSGESGKQSGADERPTRKGERRDPSRRESKPERPGHGGEGQK